MTATGSYLFPYDKNIVVYSNGALYFALKSDSLSSVYTTLSSSFMSTSLISVVEVTPPVTAGSYSIASAISSFAVFTYGLATDTLQTVTSVSGSSLSVLNQFVNFPSK